MNDQQLQEAQQLLEALAPSVGGTMECDACEGRGYFTYPGEHRACLKCGGVTNQVGVHLIHVQDGTGRILRYSHLFEAVFRRSTHVEPDREVRPVMEFWYYALNGALVADGFHYGIYATEVSLFPDWQQWDVDSCSVKTVENHPVLALIEALDKVLVKVVVNG